MYLSPFDPAPRRGIFLVEAILSVSNIVEFTEATFTYLILRR